MRRVTRRYSKSITFVVDIGRVRARLLRALSHDFPTTILSNFERRSCARSSSSNPAAGWGKMPVTARKDGCHPKYKDHGRIAGCDQCPAILRMVFLFQAPFFREP